MSGMSGMSGDVEGMSMSQLVSDFSVEVRALEGTACRSALQEPTAVVFLSGLFAGGWIWDEVWDRLPPGVPAARLCEPLALLADRQAHSITKTAAAIERALDLVSFDRFIVVGNSLGGLLALDCAVRFADRVAGVVVSGAPGLGPDQALPVRPSYTREFFDSLMERVFVDPTCVSPEQTEAILAAMKGHNQLSSVVGGLRAARRYPTGQVLKSVTCPALFVWGELDCITPPGPWLRTVPAIFGDEVHLVAGSGHSPMIEKPAEVSRLLNAFYDEVENGRRTRAAGVTSR
jgi:pimeloyl-ACP methyl ester carboxylesterase